MGKWGLTWVFVGVLGWSSIGSADVRTALIQLLMKPTPTRVLFTSAEGRAILERTVTDMGRLRPGVSAEWSVQVEELVRNVERGSGPGMLEEFYLRFLRVENRFQSRVSRGARGEEEKHRLLQAIASEELRLRTHGSWDHWFGGGAPQLGAVEFGPVPFRTDTLASIRSKMLVGQTGSKGLSAWDRAIQVLHDISESPDGAYTLFRTAEGRRVFQKVFGGGTHLYRDPARELVKAIEVSPDRELAIELAYRLNGAMERVSVVKQAGLNTIKKAAIRRAAREMLSSRDVDGRFEFLPIDSI